WRVALATSPRRTDDAFRRREAVMSRVRIRTAIAFGVWVAMVAFAQTRIAAQTNKGAIGGTVTDDSGGVIPGATVTIVNLGTGETFHVTSSDRGTFSFPILDPVDYRITVELQGFKPALVKRVKVDTATTTSVNVRLEV